jgi:hypothetical protein
MIALRTHAQPRANLGRGAIRARLLPMPMHRHALVAASLLCLASPPLWSQTPVSLDPHAVLALAETPWRDRAAFEAALDTALGGVDLDLPRLPEALRRNDPFLWSLTGRFGAELPGVASTGGIVVCSRYGIDTRDRLAESNLSDPKVFALFGATQAAGDDAKVWPEAGIARLACMITWNDTRRVAILPEAPALDALAARFARITRRDDADMAQGEGAAPARLYGDDGYLLIGTEGRSDTVVELESARIELRRAHQLIRFRAFLLNGGM